MDYATTTNSIIGFLNPTSIIVEIFTSPWIYIFFAIYLLREPISRLIDRVTRGNIGPDGFVFDTEEKKGEKQEENEESVIEKEKDSDPLDLKDKDSFDTLEEPTTLEGWDRRILFSFIEGKEDVADEAFGKLSNFSHSPERKRIEINYWKWKYIFNRNGNSFEKIKEFFGDSDIASYAKKSLADCYSNIQEYNKAILLYEESLSFSLTEKEEVKITISLANSLYLNGDKDQSFITLNNLLDKSEDSENKFEIYKTLGDLYKKEKNYEMRAIALEKAVEIKPDDTSLLFDLGYSYSESGIDELSLIYYKKSININSDDASVLNNLGVQYEKLDLPIKSVSSYNKSSKKDETLASANLAYRLMNAGFSEESKKILDDACTKDDVHPNVNSAISDLFERKQKEEDKENEIIEKAKKYQKFISSFSENYFGRKDLNLDIFGKWILVGEDKEVQMTMNMQDGKIKGSWSEEFSLRYKDGGEFKREYKFEGKLSNCAFKISIFAKEYSYLKEKYEYKLKEEGFAYIKGDSLFIMSKGKGDSVFNFYEWRKKDTLDINVNN